MTHPDLAALLAQVVEAEELRGTRLDLAEVCRDAPHLRANLEALVADYRRASDALDGKRGREAGDIARADDLPAFPGFRTIERIGGGGMGEVFKLQDLALGRIVAAKRLRPDARVPAACADTLREARYLALFDDPRYVRVYEYRADADPPFIVMEHVEGFELGAVGRSLEPRQRARVMKAACEAIHHAHGLGIQHRDLKPSNIMLDATLQPKILDFGLASADPGRGHLVGSPPYLAPEQLDPAQPIDARTDVYALGVVLYELLCGAPPFAGQTDEELLDQIRRGTPRLPAEIDPDAPEPLQAVALKAIERDPALRYQSAQEMALDLGRYLDGRPVQARPSQYASALATRVAPHLQQIQEWLRLRLIHPHEANGLRLAYQAMEGREDEWILGGRVLSYSQIALYLGAFFLIAGSLFYFGAYQFHHAIHGVGGPFSVLAVPFAGLNVTAYSLARRQHRAASVAFYLAGVALLPLFLLILLRETGAWNAPAGSAGQLFAEGVSNRQLQITIFAACVWAGWLARHTRTAALSTVFDVLLLLFTLAVLSDAGLRTWVEERQWDLLALHLAPLSLVYLGLAAWRREDAAWFARPALVSAALVLVASLEMLALHGRAFHYLGFSLRAFQAAGVEDPSLLDTLAAMTVNGLAIYGLGVASERWAPRVTRPTSLMLFSISPFAILEPAGYLAETGQYARGWDWCYLALALVIALLSHQRQRRSFYYAGLINCAVALYIVADHRQWFERPAWAVALIAAGLVALTAGLGLARRAKHRAEEQPFDPDRG